MSGRGSSIIRLPARPLEARRRPERNGARPAHRGSGALPRYLTQEELDRFRQAVIADESARDVALFGLMYRFGLRASEATLLLLEDLDLARGRIRIRRARADPHPSREGR